MSDGERVGLYLIANPFLVKQKKGLVKKNTENLLLDNYMEKRRKILLLQLKIIYQVK
jgi:hypothetical protein